MARTGTRNGGYAFRVDCCHVAGLCAQPQNKHPRWVVQPIFLCLRLRARRSPVELRTEPRWVLASRRMVLLRILSV